MSSLPYEEYHTHRLRVQQKIINESIRPTIPNDVPNDFAVLIKKCWSQDPTQRLIRGPIVFLLFFINFNFNFEINLI